MGSINSGRRDGKPLVEDCLTLDLAWLMRLGLILDGQTASGYVEWSIDGAIMGNLHFRLDLQVMEFARLVLDFQKYNPDGRQEPVRQIIGLTMTEQNFGGWRWWMVCPITGKRARTLHLPPGGNQFASRKAFGLAFRSERLADFDRPFEKVFRVQRKLGGATGLGMQLQRPKGMWHHTFACHRARIEHHYLACVGQIAALIERA